MQLLRKDKREDITFVNPFHNFLPISSVLVFRKKGRRKKNGECLRCKLNITHSSLKAEEKNVCCET